VCISRFFISGKFSLFIDFNINFTFALFPSLVSSFLLSSFLL
jgi:hypothetical protein